MMKVFLSEKKERIVPSLTQVSICSFALCPNAILPPYDKVFTSFMA